MIQKIDLGFMMNKESSILLVFSGGKEANGTASKEGEKVRSVSKMQLKCSTTTNVNP